jgi:hypothetical protein
MYAACHIAARCSTIGRKAIILFTVEERVTIGGKQFELVRVQRGGVSRVYRGDGEYVRIGEPRIIKKHLDAHTLMEKAGFQVPHFLTKGEHDGQAYFIETSMGDVRLGDAFAEDCENAGVISEGRFDELLHVVEPYLRTQLKAPPAPASLRDMKAAIHIRTLCRELPTYAERIEQRYALVRARLSEFPNTLSHGDFNPQNLFARGIIDLEHAFQGPWGYDGLTALVHINWFPDGREYEYFARYRYSDEQKKKYLALVDTIALDNGLPELSQYQHDFEFCRAVWSSVRMQEHPKLQKWRYDMFIERFL